MSLHLWRLVSFIDQPKQALPDTHLLWLYVLALQHLALQFPSVALCLILVLLSPFCVPLPNVITNELWPPLCESYMLYALVKVCLPLSSHRSHSVGTPLRHLTDSFRNALCPVHAVLPPSTSKAVKGRVLPVLVPLFYESFSTLPISLCTIPLQPHRHHNLVLSPCSSRFSWMPQHSSTTSATHTPNYSNASTLRSALKWGMPLDFARSDLRLSRYEPHPSRYVVTMSVVISANAFFAAPSCISTRRVLHPCSQHRGHGLRP